MISTYRAASSSCSQRRDRLAEGVIRVVLVRCPGREQPDPGAELGLDIDDLLAGRQQLLGQQVTQAARALALATTAQVRSGRAIESQTAGIPGRYGKTPQCLRDTQSEPSGAASWPKLIKAAGQAGMSVAMMLE